MTASSDRRLAIWIFLTIAALHLLVTRGHFVSTDEVSVYQTARSLWEDGDLSIAAVVNTHPGKDGQPYSQYNVGLPVAALPLYVLGKTVDRSLRGNGFDEWAEVFAGPDMAQEPTTRWGGDVEIFFVNLFNIGMTALLCVLAYYFARLIGTRPVQAGITAILLGTVTYPAAYSVGLFQHTSEAVFLLAALFFLVSDARCPKTRSRCIAGISLALAVLIRQPAAIVWPLLTFYLLWNLWQRRETGIGAFSRQTARELLPFALPLVIALAINFAIANAIFGRWMGPYTDFGFDNPLIIGLYGFLFSPGESIFLFTPLLVLAPWALNRLWMRDRPLTWLFIGLSCTYLVFYGSFNQWHGMWAFGPRYLVPLTALLVVPLGLLFNEFRLRHWLLVFPLILAGLWMQAIHIAVNPSFVFHYEKYAGYPWDFLFIPERAPVVAMSRALLAGDYRLDMWLINTVRAHGAGYFIVLFLPLAALFVFSAWRLITALAANRQTTIHIANNFDRLRS